MLDLDLIRIDGDTQSREKIDEAVVAEYAEAFKAGAQFPPVKVFFDGVHRWLADGFHRFHGARAAGLTSIYEDITPGTREEAQLYSYGANGNHGLRRTNADKRRAVEGALQHPVSSAWSDNLIAKHCGVSPTTVGTVRRSLSNLDSENPAERTYTTRHGTEAVMNTANIGRASAPAAEPAQAGSPPAAPPAADEPGTALDMTDSRGVDPLPPPAPAPRAPSPAPRPPAVQEEPAEDQQRVAGLVEETAALREQLRDTQQDLDHYVRIVEQSDPLKEAVKVATEQRTLAQGLQARINSLMTEVAELKRQVSSWKRKAGVTS